MSATPTTPEPGIPEATLAQWEREHEAYCDGFKQDSPDDEWPEGMVNAFNAHAVDVDDRYDALLAEVRRLQREQDRLVDALREAPIKVMADLNAFATQQRERATPPAPKCRCSHCESVRATPPAPSEDARALAAEAKWLTGECADAIYSACAPDRTVAERASVYQESAGHFSRLHAAVDRLAALASTAAPASPREPTPREQYEEDASTPVPLTADDWNEERQRLLAVQFTRPLTFNEAARLRKATAIVQKAFPRVTAEDYAALAAISETARAMDGDLAEIRADLASTPTTEDGR